MKDKYSAVVKMIDSGDKLKLDQTHLETVIPAPGGALTSDLNPSLVHAALSKLGVSPAAGKRVLILNGAHRDAEALLEGINEKSFSATLTLDLVSLQPLLDFTSVVLSPLSASTKFCRLAFRDSRGGGAWTWPTRTSPNWRDWPSALLPD